MARIQEEQLTSFFVENQVRFYRLAYSYLKNREEALDAVQTAVWLHGRAGDLCAGRMGEYAMNPTDVIAALPEVTKPIIR